MKTDSTYGKLVFRILRDGQVHINIEYGKLEDVDDATYQDLVLCYMDSLADDPTFTFGKFKHMTFDQIFVGFLSYLMFNHKDVYGK